MAAPIKPVRGKAGAFVISGTDKVMRALLRQYRHEFDAVQRECPELRGEDYEDKTKVVQEKLLEFGYEPGYHQDIKQEVV